MISVSDRVENIVRKNRKCFLPALPPFPIMFSISKGPFWPFTQYFGLVLSESICK